MDEEMLPGGFIAGAVRVGDTVHKAPPADPGFVHGLLRHLEGWGGAPRFLGSDGQGRAVLGYLDGVVPWERGVPPGYVRSDRNLRAVARLLREFHDLTAGTAPAGAHEVVCHNDLSPKNTVYRDRGSGLEPVGFIDWDIAAPGRRVEDVAHVCWQFVGLGSAIPGRDEATRQARAEQTGTTPAVWAEAEEQTARKVWVVADGYGLGDADRAALVDTILWWQERCWRGILTGAQAGQPAMIRLCELGAADQVRAAYEWTRRHSARIRVAGGQAG
ncbi:aminoglycoside phosphotransferase family protein [Actinoplanes hulinensis]|uniref:Aminoglycoside phosphotransferase family protein n=1 Tax=Actinoplanes hulinensis TaxID=1144547 RepID=A0ABS7B3T6_9ACTN|nr:phosphotransferase [Actinoplanes hulinensis]MBW6435635.1 aminoglycoside phosphotransferase family protein [Actinoplanes hulinensis]